MVPFLICGHQSRLISFLVKALIRHGARRNASKTDDGVRQLCISRDTGSAGIAGLFQDSDESK